MEYDVWGLSPEAAVAVWQRPPQWLLLSLLLRASCCVAPVGEQGRQSLDVGLPFVPAEPGEPMLFAVVPIRWYASPCIV